jgi:hypothetical protein
MALRRYFLHHNPVKEILEDSISVQKMIRPRVSKVGLDDYDTDDSENQSPNPPIPLSGKNLSVCYIYHIEISDLLTWSAYNAALLMGAQTW